MIIRTRALLALLLFALAARAAAASPRRAVETGREATTVPAAPPSAPHQKSSSRVAGPSAAVVAPAAMNDGLSGREAVRLALERNPGLRALRRLHETAAARIDTARALPDPELRMGYQADDDGLEAGQKSYDLGLRWSPPRPGELRRKAELAREALDETDAHIRREEAALAAEVLTLHAKIAFLDRQSGLEDEALALHREMVGCVKRQVEAAVKSLLDQNVAELALADARAMGEASRRERRVCWTRLCHLLDLPVSTTLRVRTEKDPLRLAPRALDPTALARKAAADRPELAAAQARLRQSETNLDIRKNERYPWFSFLQVDRRFRDHGEADSWGVRAGIRLPLFSRRAHPERPLAAAVDQAQADLAAEKHKVRSEVENAAEELRNLYEQAEQLRSLVGAELERGVELARQCVETAQGDELLLLAARARKLQGQQRLCAALLECRLREIELDHLSGSVLPPFDPGPARGEAAPPPTKDPR